MTLDTCGFEVIDDFLSTERMEDIHAEIDRHTRSGVAGIRHAEDIFSSIQTLVTATDTIALTRQHLQTEPQLVRCILFDKTADNNWLVAWHQDKMLCVTQKFERNGWSPWSIKDGTHHVQPPVAVLNRMLTLRIHLDEATNENGCLKVIPTTHKLGILSSEQIQCVSKSKAAIACCAAPGSVLIMKPLLLHASSKAIIPNRRRIIHVEYIDPAAMKL